MLCVDLRFDENSFRKFKLPGGGQLSENEARKKLQDKQRNSSFERRVRALHDLFKVRLICLC